MKNEIVHKALDALNKTTGIKATFKEKGPWEETTCAVAVENGHLNCLKYLHEKGCPWDEWSYFVKQQNKNIECLDFLKKNNCPFNENL